MSSFLNLVLRDVSFERPFVPEKKCIAPAVAAALVGAGSSILSGVAGLAEQANTNNTNWDIAQLNARSQRETNESNQFIAQQTNAMNRALLREQNAYNERMWEKQMAYNSPQHMVELYKAANLNPALLAGGAGQVAAAGELRSGEPKATERAQMVAPQLNYQRQSFDWNSAANSVVNAYNQSKLIDSESRKNYSTSANIEVLTEKERKAMSSYLLELKNRANKTGFEGKLARKEFEYINAINDVRANLVRGDFAIQQKNLDMLGKQLFGADLDNQLKQIQVRYQPLLNDKQLAQMDSVMSQISAEIGLITANKFKSEAEAKHEMLKAVGTIIDNGMKSVDFKVKNGTKKYVSDMIKNQSFKSYWENENEAQKYQYGGFGPVMIQRHYWNH